jgi:cyclophilin family peptidyl-prolyl cis-trans isomerase
MKRMLLLTLGLGLMAAASVRAANPIVVIETSLGSIKVELYPDKAPITVKNFLSYVDDRFYNDTIFHRVIPNFMIQGGGFVQGFRPKKARDPIKNEASNGLSNRRGTIAMARTNVPDSATAQFFINVVDNEGLDRDKTPDRVGYCVFGKVVDGMDVVDKIKAVATSGDSGFPLPNAPLKDVIIKSVRRVDK